MTQPSRVEAVQVGREGETVVVVDDFAPDPDALVERARALRFERQGAFYPGPRAHVGPAYLPSVAPVLTSVLRDCFGCRRSLNVQRALYSLVTEPAERLSLAQRIPHVDDVSEDRIAIVHYLFRGDLGGTAFFRHRSTGFETIDAGRQRAYLDRLKAEFDRIGQPPAAYIAGDTALFERIGGVAPAWNRAVIYRSRLLHCAEVPPAAISGDVGSGRLTIASFLTAS